MTSAEFFSAWGGSYWWKWWWFLEFKTIDKIYKRYSLPIQGSIFRSENDIYSPPPKKINKLYFSPSCHTSFYDSNRGLLALILPYFAIILPFYFPFSHFLSPFPFLPFSFTLSSFFLFAFSYFFSQVTSADIPPPPPGGRVFSNI